MGRYLQRTILGVSCGSALGLSLLVVGGCASSGSTSGAEVRAPREMAPMPMGQAGRGSQPTPPPSDLTKPRAWAMNETAAEIIDTRLFAVQINPVLVPPEGTRNIREMLPEEAADLPMRLGEPNDLPVGEIIAARRATVGAKWPGISAGPWVPPDPTLAAGPSHIVEMVNSTIAWFDKSGTKQFEAAIDGPNGFFGELGAGSFVFDPKCLFDQYSGRFVVTALDVDFDNAGAWIIVAISDDADPNGVWYKYRTDCRVQIGSGTYWVDYPGFGYDANGIYITGNLFLLEGSGGGFGGAFYRSFKKSTMLSGGTVQYTDLRDATTISAQSVQHYGSNPAPMFVSVNSTALIKVQAIKNAFTSPLLVTTTVPVPDFSYPGNPVTDKSGNAYDQLDGRIINTTWRGGKLLAGHGIGLSNRNVARWYEFDTHNWPTSGIPTLVQAGNVDEGPGTHTWFPALIHNKFGVIGMVMSRSSNTTFPSVYVTGHLANDPLGTMGELELAIEATRTSRDWRYGDYFDIALDPDGKTFWVVGEYYPGGSWKTWISSFLVTCAGDYNEDGAVDSRDVIAFLNDWSGHADGADWNDDGVFDTRDVIGFLNAYAQGC